MRKRSKLWSGSIVLAMGTFIAKIFGMFYRIPLTNMLGCYGLGLYQMIFPVYTVLLDFSGAGVPSALSRLISAFSKEERYIKAGEYLRASIRLLVILGLIGTLVMAIASKGFAIAQGDVNSTLGYVFLSPAVVIVCLISCLRGYFQGQMNMVPTAISQVVEQVVKLAFGLLFVYLLLPDVKRAVAGAAFAITVSEFSALIQLFITYKIDKKKHDNFLSLQNDTTKIKEITPLNLLTKHSIKTTVPITITGILIPIAHVIDSLLVVNLISVYRADATVLFGISSGVVCTIINLPVALCYGVATTSIPAVSSLNNNEEQNKTAKKAVLITIGVSFAFTIATFFGAELIIKILFRNLSIQEKQTAISLLKLTSPTILLLSIVQTTNGILIGKGRLYLPVLTLGGGIVLKTVISFLTLSNPSINIYGSAIALIACYFAVGLVNLILIFTLKAKDGNKKINRGQCHA